MWPSWSTTARSGISIPQGGKFSEAEATRAAAEVSAWALPRLADEFGHVRGRFHHEQATVDAPRTVCCPSLAAPGEHSSLLPAPDSPPASHKLAPFV